MEARSPSPTLIELVESARNWFSMLAVPAAAQGGYPPPPRVLAEEVAELYQSYEGLMSRYAMLSCRDREVSRDLVQETFVRYYDARRSGEEVDNPRAWLFRVLRNHIIDEHRKQARRPEIRYEGAHAMDDPSSTADGPAQVAETWKLIAARVSPKELECLKLRASGFTYAEIAEILGVQVGTVSVFLSRAIDKTRGLLLSPKS